LNFLSWASDGALSAAMVATVAMSASDAPFIIDLNFFIFTSSSIYTTKFSGNVPILG
jgi:hypothetical protein